MGAGDRRKRDGHRGTAHSRRRNAGVRAGCQPPIQKCGDRGATWVGERLRGRSLSDSAAASTSWSAVRTAAMMLTMPPMTRRLMPAAPLRGAGSATAERAAARDPGPVLYEQAAGLLASAGALNAAAHARGLAQPSDRLWLVLRHPSMPSSALRSNWEVRPFRHPHSPAWCPLTCGPPRGSSSGDSAP